MFKKAAKITCVLGLMHMGLGLVSLAVMLSWFGIAKLFGLVPPSDDLGMGASAVVAAGMLFMGLSFAALEASEKLDTPRKAQ